jgi:hypothetical protein
MGRLVLGACLIASSALAQQPPAVDPLPSVTLPADLARVLTDYEKAWRARDASACYTGAGGALFLRATGYAAESGHAYIIGGFRFTESDGDAGKFVLTLIKGADGRWLIVADMDRPYARR